ncbi:hypothetical protein Bca4012_058587 [Brassica carinata]
MTSLIGKKDLACKHFIKVKALYVSLTLSQTAKGVELWRQKSIFSYSVCLPLECGTICLLSSIHPPTYFSRVPNSIASLLNDCHKMTNFPPTGLANVPLSLGPLDSMV